MCREPRDESNRIVFKKPNCTQHLLEVFLLKPESNKVSRIASINKKYEGKKTQKVIPQGSKEDKTKPGTF